MHILLGVGQYFKTFPTTIKGVSCMIHQKQHKPLTTGQFIRKYIMLIIGATIDAAAIELFLVDNSIIVGGIIIVLLLLNHISNIIFSNFIYFIYLSFHVFYFIFIFIIFFFYS